MHFTCIDTFTYEISDGRGGTARATVTVTVRAPQVQAVTWVARAGSPLTANLGPGGGLRIFPDKDALNPTTVSTVDRSYADAKVTLTPATPGVTVYFKLIDVDDPSSSLAPIDNENIGSDNRNTATPAPVQTATTGASGTATVRFQVSMQPDDNYRFVAIATPISSGQFGAIQNDTTLARVKDRSTRGGAIVPYNGPAYAVASDMLTVWRRVHVERDTMGAVTGNTIAGTITNVGRASNGSVTVTTDQPLEDEEQGRFNGGTLRDSTGKIFPVITHTTRSDFTVTVTISASLIPAAGAFTLVDDDVLTDGQTLPLPDVTTLAPALKDAYVEPVYDVGTTNLNVPFVLNATRIDRSHWDSIGLNGPDFWVVYALEAFQRPRDIDNDPDLPLRSPDSPLEGEANVVKGGSAIYYETNIDLARSRSLSPVVEVQETVVHELGHLLFPAGNHPVTKSNSVYVPDYISGIRSSKKPAGD